MEPQTKFPGPFPQQQILESITAFYKEDERVLAVLLFGSLSRGNWDPYSDIDLDIVLADNTSIDARLELKKLCTALQQKHGYEALTVADVEEGDVVLSNLVQFSVRYHILSDTKPAILESMRSLSGSLSLDEIRAAANHDYDSEPTELDEIVNQAIRYTLELHNAIRRQRLWMALEMLGRIRASLMLLVAITRESIRPIHFFDAQASSELQEYLIGLTPKANLESIEKAFRRTLYLLENHLDEFSAGNYRLTESQKQILNKLKQLEIVGKS